MTLRYAFVVGTPSVVARGKILVPSLNLCGFNITYSECVKKMCQMLAQKERAHSSKIPNVF